MNGSARWSIFSVVLVACPFLPETSSSSAPISWPRNSDLSETKRRPFKAGTAHFMLNRLMKGIVQNLVIELTLDGMTHYSRRQGTFKEGKVDLPSLSTDPISIVPTRRGQNNDHRERKRRERLSHAYQALHQRPLAKTIGCRDLYPGSSQGSFPG